MTYMQDLGRIGLGSRLKHLSNELFKITSALYQDMGIELDSTCFPLLNKIHESGAINLREAQIHLGTSHADISQKSAKLQKAGLITARTDPNDQRSKILNLTTDGQAAIKKARPLWQAIDRTLAKLLHPNEEAFFAGLQNMEAQIRNGSLLDLYKAEHETTADENSNEVVPYAPEYKEEFERLNREWLDKYFIVEKVDQDMFDDPEGTIIKPGGHILFSKNGDDITGTCGLYRQGNDLELCKMGVDPRYRGLGIASLLINEALKTAKAAKANSVYLLTHSKLKSAQHLYKKHGFKEESVTPKDKEKYDRVDIRMTYKL